MSSVRGSGRHPKTIRVSLAGARGRWAASEVFDLIRFSLVARASLVINAACVSKS